MKLTNLMKTGKRGLVIGKYQDVFVGIVLVMPMNTVFETDALHKFKIGFAVLHTVFPRYRGLGCNVETQLTVEDPVLLAHLDDDLRHRHSLVYPLVMPMLQLI